MITLKIACRYLLSPKSHSVVNTISWVSVVAMAVPVMAMVVILSLHNGLSSYLEDMYKDFDAPMQITAVDGDRVFECDSALMCSIRAVSGVSQVSRVLRQNVLLVSGSGNHAVATLVGVDSLYGEVVPLGERVVAGGFNPQIEGSREALLGQGIAYELGVNLGMYDPIQVFALGPKPKTRSLFDYAGYTSVELMPRGIYRLDMQSDSKYVFTELSILSQLMALGPDHVSSLEIALAPNQTYQKIEPKIQKILEPKELKAKSRFQQKETMYKVVQGEKVIIYALLVMVLIIALLSLAGQSSMLVAEKQTEIKTLSTIGFSKAKLTQIFILQGLLVVAIGCAIGLTLGVALCVMQQQYGLLQMSGTSFVMQNYPIKLKWQDLAYITSTVIILGTTLLTIVCSRIVKQK